LATQVESLAKLPGRRSLAGLGLGGHRRAGFARLGGAFGEAWAEPCATLRSSVLSGSARLEIRYDLSRPTEAGYAKTGGQEPQGCLLRRSPDLTESRDEGWTGEEG